ncbi:hypothetical protein COBT_002869 [Conglomerata obtusa]
MKKVCVILGGGGHSTEMQYCLKSILHKYEITYISDKNDFMTNTKFRLIRPTNIKKRINLLLLLKSFYSALILTYKIGKHDFVICNGPGICIIFSFLMKIIYGTKVIYIESVARKYTLSTTGKIMEWFADFFVVQSLELNQKQRILYNFFL